LLFQIHKRLLFLLIYKKNLMQKNSEDFEYCIKLAINNAKKRINKLDDLDKKCVLDEYKEWINDDFSKHKVLVLREDPII